MTNPTLKARKLAYEYEMEHGIHSYHDANILTTKNIRDSFRIGIVTIMSKLCLFK